MSRIILIAMSASLLSGCDPYRMKKCEWQIRPDFENIDIAKPGYATVCLRNNNNDREKCMYQIKIELAQKLHGKRFRFHDVEVSSEKRPRPISKVTTCKP